MKKIFLFLVSMLVLASCSNDGSESPQPITPSANTYNYTINGVPYSGAFFYMPLRMENEFIVRCDTDTDLQFNFDASGHLGKVYLRFNSPEHLAYVERYSYVNYPEHFFTFDLISVDDVNKRVKFSFSGRLYKIENNLSSEYTEIAGEIDTHYIDDMPVVTGLMNHAKLNGESWGQTRVIRTFGAGGDNNNYDENGYSGGPYKLTVAYNTLDVAVGTYNFDASTVTNCVRLSKFNPETMAYTVYDTQGTMNITQKAGLGTSYTLSGNYSFTAVNPGNPSDVIQVTEGNFKLRN